ncbi:MAG: carbohydrate kinase family protein [Candidatus Woesearchaeota archaeon]
MYDVITVGSNTLDAFVHTDVEVVNISKKTKKKKEVLAYPLGSKILITNLEFHLGGGGTNTAASFKKLGFKTAYLGKIGHDENGAKILHEINKLNIDFIGAFGKQSGYSVILDSIAHDRTILTHKGSNDNFRYREVDKTKLKTKWFYFSSMMSSSLDLLKSLARYAQKNNIKLTFNPSEYLVVKGIKELNPILAATNILVFNKEEALLLTKTKNMNDAFKQLKKIIKPKGVIVITDGSRGAYGYDGENLLHAHPKKVKLVETTGAGDAFASAFTAAIMTNNNIKNALKWGMIQAEQVIQSRGAKNKLLTKKEMLYSIKKDKRKIITKKL